MDFRRVHPCQWLRHIYRRRLVGIDCRAYIVIGLEQFGRHHRLVAFALLFSLFLSFLPFVELLLLLLQPPFVGLLREYLQGVGLRYERPRAVGHAVLQLNVQRVLVDESGVAEPVGYSVGIDRWLDDERVVGVEVQSFNPWHLTVAVSEDEREVVGLRAVGFLGRWWHRRSCRRLSSHSWR